MQLIILAALLATLAQTETAPAAITAAPAAGAGGDVSVWKLLLMLLTALAAPVATACDAGWFVTTLRKSDLTSNADWRRAGERYERLQLAALWLWLAGALAVIYLWRWPRIVQVTWGLQIWPLLDDALILLPALASLLLVWSVFHAVERIAQRIRQVPEPQTSLWTYLAWNTRHYLAMALVPAFLVLATQEALLRYPIGPVAWWLALPAVLAVPLALPLLLARVWPTVELPAGELRERIESICAEAKTPLTRLLVWQTQGRMTNAAVAGLSRWCRYLFLTDALLVQLAPEEVAAVVRHELAHLQRRHLLQRLLVLAIPVLAGLALQSSQVLPADWLAMSSPFSLGVAALYVVFALLVVAPLCRWLEYDADLAACWDARGRLHADHVRDLIHALVALQGPQRESRLANLLHPPTVLRIAWLRRVLLRPEEGIAFRRRAGWLALAIYGLVGVSVLGWLWG